MKHDPDLIVPPTNLTTALFIDADNLSVGHAAQIFRECGPAPRLVRAYGNLLKGAQGWSDCARVEFIHTGAGKNASDLALAVAAMDAAHRFNLTRILICSCDSDFRHLAIALRTMGITVVGMGREEDKSTTFAEACTHWLPLKKLPAAPAKTAKVAAQAKGPSSDEALKASVKLVGDQTIPLTKFADALKREHGFDRATFKAATWAKAFSAPECPLEVIGSHPGLQVRRRKGRSRTPSAPCPS